MEDSGVIYNLMQAATCRKEIYDSVMKAMCGYNRDRAIRDIAKKFCEKYINIYHSETGEHVNEFTPKQVTQFAKELKEWYAEEYNAAQKAKGENNFIYV